VTARKVVVDVEINFFYRFFFGHNKWRPAKLGFSNSSFLFLILFEWLLLPHALQAQNSRDLVFFNSFLVILFLFFAGGGGIPFGNRSAWIAI
jgi:hypothetical protein